MREAEEANNGRLLTSSDHATSSLSVSFEPADEHRDSVYGGLLHQPVHALHSASGPSMSANEQVFSELAAQAQHLHCDSWVPFMMDMSDMVAVSHLPDAPRPRAHIPSTGVLAPGVRKSEFVRLRAPASTSNVVIWIEPPS